MIRNKQGKLVDNIDNTKTEGCDDVEASGAICTSKADEIIKMFKEQVFARTAVSALEDRAHRATKVICTLGHQNKTKDKIKELM